MRSAPVAGYYSADATVTSDDELAQTFGADAADALSDGFGDTLANADRILEAARELDRRLIADAFAEAQRVAEISGIAAATPPDATAESLEVQKVRVALNQARLEVEEKERQRYRACQDLTATQRLLEAERESTKLLSTELQEERRKLLLESSKREALERRCEELEDLTRDATSTHDRDPAGPGGTHGEATAMEERTGPHNITSEDFDKIVCSAGKLGQSLQDVEKCSRHLWTFASTDVAERS
eukprot:TRINITY_DN65943_c0_g1_i1.p1 TRINITY_DN65943_c0_g1~~TRINITY_DN65943_c0_g1_i1.p1  ORF type:complete len:243 (-),score=67.48 TRINITY_DN65943_c0_g1_i1:94-822(-)